MQRCLGARGRCCWVSEPRLFVWVRIPCPACTCPASSGQNGGRSDHPHAQVPHQPPPLAQAVRNRRPAPRPAQRLQGRAAGQARGDVQGREGVHHRLWVPHRLWWRQIDRVRGHLRLAGRAQEARAQVPADPERHVRAPGDLAQAAQGAQEPGQEGAGHQEGQGGRSGQRQEEEEVNAWSLLCTFGNEERRYPNLLRVGGDPESGIIGLCRWEARCWGDEDSWREAGDRTLAPRSTLRPAGPIR